MQSYVNYLLSDIAAAGREAVNKTKPQPAADPRQSLLSTWHISADIHIQVPISKMYSLLVSVLDEKVSIGLEGTTIIEFCNYHPPSCAMGEYCTCRHFYEEETKRTKE